MTASHNINGLLDRLPPEIAALLSRTVEAAGSLGLQAYLVGGIVRDLLLGRPGLDVDVTVEGDALAVARRVSQEVGGRLVLHHQFGTASVYVNSLVLDLATTRKEHYPKAGSLPEVRPGTIYEDLGRRDFTINAMAMTLTGVERGALIDPLGGASDLRSGTVRIIHERSFVDDATRMLRAVRYEQRFGFHLGTATEALLRRDTAMLASISGERLRYELERIFGEQRPWLALGRAAELGLLAGIHPALSWGQALAGAFERLRAAGTASLPAQAALLTLPASETASLELAARLSFPISWLRAITDARRLGATLPSLEAQDLRASQLATILDGLSGDAIAAMAAAAPSLAARAHLHRYQHDLVVSRPILTGRDVLSLGIPQGPAVGEALTSLRAAKLDGILTTRDEEMAFMKAWFKERGFIR